MNFIKCPLRWAFCYLLFPPSKNVNHGLSKDVNVFIEAVYVISMWDMVSFLCLNNFHPSCSVSIDNGLKSPS